MSRIGRTPIKIPEKVSCTIDGRKIIISGPMGVLEFSLLPKMKVSQRDEELVVESEDNSRSGKSLFGLTRALIANIVKGVSIGFRKELELSGVGYRAQVEGEDLKLTLGFSHPVIFKAPTGIKLTVTENRIAVEGVDNKLVGEVASQIRNLRPAEPYKGKGIRYLGEKIRLKPGKVAKTVGGKP